MTDIYSSTAALVKSCECVVFLLLTLYVLRNCCSLCLTDREQNDPRLLKPTGEQPVAFEEEAWYGEEGMGWLEPDNVATTISYEEARARMEAEVQKAMIPVVSTLRPYCSAKPPSVVVLRCVRVCCLRGPTAVTAERWPWPEAVMIFVGWLARL